MLTETKRHSMQKFRLFVYLPTYHADELFEVLTDYLKDPSHPDIVEKFTINHTLVVKKPSVTAEFNYNLQKSFCYLVEVYSAVTTFDAHEACALADTIRNELGVNVELNAV